MGKLWVARAIHGLSISLSTGVGVADMSTILKIYRGLLAATLLVDLDWC